MSHAVAIFVSVQEDPIPVTKCHTATHVGGKKESRKLLLPPIPTFATTASATGPLPAVTMLVRLLLAFAPVRAANGKERDEKDLVI